MQSSNWINQIKPRPFINNSNIKPASIFFLYDFLGDGYEIKTSEYIKNLQIFKKQNQDFIIRILRKHFDKLDIFVQKCFPFYYDMYVNYPKNIQRCDVIRYMLMYEYGGVYSDLDVKPNISVKDILMKYNHANVILGVGRIKPNDKCHLTTIQETIREGEKESSTRLSNYFFISRIPNHPFWIDILDLAKVRSKKK